MTVRATFQNELDYGKTAYMQRIRLDRDDAYLLDEFAAYVQRDWHFGLAGRTDTGWYFRFPGSNAPLTLHSKDMEFHHRYPGHLLLDDGFLHQSR